jgi:hypothetical protein
MMTFRVKNVSITARTAVVTQIVWTKEESMIN